MALVTHKYKGYIIRQCERAPGQHNGEWIIVDYYPGGLEAADEICAHYWTLKDAKASINEGKDYTEQCSWGCPPEDHCKCDILAAAEYQEV